MKWNRVDPVKEMGGFGGRVGAVWVLLLLIFSSSFCWGSEDKVTVSVYYESLCPFCANFVVYHLVKLFQNGLISTVHLRMIPWGNAWIRPDDGAFLCQVPHFTVSNFTEYFFFSIFYSISRLKKLSCTIG